MGNAPPPGAQLVTANPAPFVIAPKQPEGPPQGATLVKSTAPPAALAAPKQPDKPSEFYGAEDSFPQGEPGKRFEQLGQSVIGAAKDLGSTAYGMVKNLPGGPMLEKVAGPYIEEKLKPKGAAQEGGALVSQGLQYGSMIPGAFEGVAAVNAWRAERALSKLINSETASKMLTDAVNPRPAAMEGFEGTLSKEMPRVVDYAKRSGIEIKSRASLQKAIQGAGDEAYHDYYEQFIEPTKDVPVSTNDIHGYQGGTIGEGHTATIGALEARLRTINATLYPKFQKGGVAAEAAISAESAASLDAEAAGIRAAMNETIGKKLGIDPQEISKARSTFGSLHDTADKTTRALNEERFGKNLERRGMDLPTDKAGAIRWGIRKITAKNPDKAVAETMQRLKIDPPPSPEAQLAAHRQSMAQRAQADAQRAAQAKVQQQQQAKQVMMKRIQSIKAAGEKLGPKASVKEIMAEADKTGAQQ